MYVLAFKEGHDGAISAISDGELLFSYEPEKDSGYRFSNINISTALCAFEKCHRVPDVLAVSGFVKALQPTLLHSRGCYRGIAPGDINSEKTYLAGQAGYIFESSHERSHLMCSYGLSPFPQGQPCYALLWEGGLGCFYKIDASLNIELIGTPLLMPGVRYNLIYAIGKGEKTFDDGSFAGKLMALSAFGSREKLATPDQANLIEAVLKFDNYKISVDDYKWSPFYGIGVTNADFRQLACLFSDRLYEIFYDFANKNMKERLPLLIGGGCGLNCDWNSRWLNSKLFEDVFIPPCVNDSGSAIGTAIDAYYHYTGNAKIKWNVSCGQEWVYDECEFIGFDCEIFNPINIASDIHQGAVIAFIQGKCEIGPRALGHRSLLAAPFSEKTKDRLNHIKHRENYRPIAPICPEEDALLWFSGKIPSPFMLYFNTVLSPTLKAVTHVDGSARLQTLNSTQNARLYQLLMEFKKISGFSVLCNTSLNFSGKGFINRNTDLYKYAIDSQLDGFVIEDKYYKKIPINLIK